MAVTTNKTSPVEREILRPLWKVHILHHASHAPILGHWIMEELRKHGYNVIAILTAAFIGSAASSPAP
ncbi:MAG: hypothetical protein HY736_07080 [Verrucomicrobia bacterium]|nr:hypothetical protein [Verrucomicrobiota bacterium]